MHVMASAGLNTSCCIHDLSDVIAQPIMADHTQAHGRTELGVSGIDRKQV